MGYEAAKSSIVVKINGEKHDAQISPTLDKDKQKDFRDINLLGANFLRLCSAEVWISYAAKNPIFTIKFKN